MIYTNIFLKGCRRQEFIPADIGGEAGHILYRLPVQQKAET